MNYLKTRIYFEPLHVKHSHQMDVPNGPIQSIEIQILNRKGLDLFWGILNSKATYGDRHMRAWVSISSFRIRFFEIQDVLR